MISMSAPAMASTAPTMVVSSRHSSYEHHVWLHHPAARWTAGHAAGLQQEVQAVEPAALHAVVPVDGAVELVHRFAPPPPGGARRCSESQRRSAFPPPPAPPVSNELHWAWPAERAFCCGKIGRTPPDSAQKNCGLKSSPAEMRIAGGYRPSTLRKSGMPDSVLTPAPPKKTMRLLSSTHFCRSSAPVPYPCSFPGRCPHMPASSLSRSRSSSAARSAVRSRSRRSWESRSSTWAAVSSAERRAVPILSWMYRSTNNPSKK